MVAGAVVDGRGREGGFGWERGCECFWNLVMSDCILQSNICFGLNSPLIM